jgi:pyruvate dehydrogenase E1 component alpha subunit
LDVEAVRAVVGEAIERARRGDGPSLIEARTRRMHGHNFSDKATYRTTEESSGADPLEHFTSRLLQHGEATPATLQQIQDSVSAEVTEAVERAKAAQDAGPAELGLDEVYA